MKNTLLLFIAIGGLFLASCTNVSKTMREPLTTVELYADDFELSSQVSASAKSTRILFIDFERLFKKEQGFVDKDNISVTLDYGSIDIPVIGSFISDPTASYAMYNLMEANSGYDVVFYPQFKTTYKRPFLGLPVFTITTVDVSARLGKFK